MMDAATLSAPDALASAVRKVRWRLLPIFVVMFIVNYVDRVNVSFIKPQLEASLGIGATAYGLGAGLFFWGYAVFEVPANLALERMGARRWLTLIAAVWGALAALLAFVRTAEEFYTLRFLLGAAEAGFFPGVVYTFTRWFPAAERGRAMAVFLSGSAIASVISGPLSAALLSIQGLGLQGWQWMVLLEGVFSVGMAGVLWFWLDALPADARWLEPAERAALTAAVESERAAAITRPKAGLGELLLDLRLLFFCWVYFAIQLTIYAVTFWLPEIIRGMGGLSDLQVGLFNSIPWLISIAGMYFFAVAAARRPGQQGWVAVALIVAGLGMFAATFGGPVSGFVCICVSALGFKSAASLFWPLPQKELDPRIAAAGIALINSLGNLGGFVAPTAFGWIKETTGNVTWGLHGLAASSLLTAALVLLVRFRRA
jgi:MFS family permease